jgi:hypothetical protein
MVKWLIKMVNGKMVHQNGFLQVSSLPCHGDVNHFLVLEDGVMKWLEDHLRHLSQSGQK